MFPTPRLGSRTKCTALPAASEEESRRSCGGLDCFAYDIGYHGALWYVEALIKPTDYRHLAAVSDDWPPKSRGNYASRRPWR